MRRLQLMPAFVVMLVTPVSTALAQSDLNDLEMAHVALTASDIDIAYAHLALAFSEHPAVRSFAETMIRDHSAVNSQLVTLAMNLHVEVQDNDFSRQLVADAVRTKHEMAALRGVAFDRFYAANELRYHQAVNDVVETAFIPNADHPDVKSAFEAALPIFRRHERHAQQIVTQLGGDD